MPPKGRRKSQVVPQPVALDSFSPSNTLSSIAAQPPASQPQKRYLTLRPQVKEKLDELLSSTTATAAATAPHANDTMGRPPSQAFPSADPATMEEQTKRFSMMLRAVYVIARTEKAQLQVRHQINVLQPLPQQQPMSPVKGRLATSSVMYRTSLLAPGTPNSRRTSTVTAEAALYHSTPPPSPSKVHYFTTASPSSSPSSSGAPTGGTWTSTMSAPSASYPNHISAPSSLDAPTKTLIVTFADARWRAAVSEYLHESFTLDHLAQLAVLFPTFLRVAWSNHMAAAFLTPSASSPASSNIGGSSQSSIHSVDDALRALAQSECCYSEDEHFGGGGGDGFTQSSPSSTRGGGDVKARVTLLRDDVPPVELLMEEVKSTESFVQQLPTIRHITAYGAFLESWNASHPSASATLQKHAALSSSSIAVPPDPIRFDSHHDDDSRSDVKKRPRERENERSTAANVDQHPDVEAQIPEGLKGFLSEEKLRQVARALKVQQRAELLHEAQHVRRQRQLEQLLGLYDLIRVTFGPGKNTLGGGRLLDALSTQNRSGLTKEDVAQLLQALMSYPQCGLTAVCLDESFEEPLNPTAGNRHCTTGPCSTGGMLCKTYEAAVFYLSPKGSRHELEDALLRREQAAPVAAT